MADPAITPVQRPAGRARPRGVLTRLSLGHVVMIVSGLLAFLLTFTLLRARDETARVAVAAEAIAAGATVTAESFRVVEVDVSSEQLDTMIPAVELEAMSGWIAVNGLSHGEVAATSDFQPPASSSGLRAMSVPIAPEHAVGGAISSGDLVDVIAVRDGVAEYLVQQARVLAVDSPNDSGGLVDVRGSLTLTLEVDEATALALAGALNDGAIEVVRSTGATEDVLSDEPALAPAPEPSPTADDSSARDDRKGKGRSKGGRGS